MSIIRVLKGSCCSANVSAKEAQQEEASSRRNNWLESAKKWKMEHATDTRYLFENGHGVLFTELLLGVDERDSTSSTQSIALDISHFRFLGNLFSILLFKN